MIILLRSSITYRASAELFQPAMPSLSHSWDACRESRPAHVGTMDMNNARSSGARLNERGLVIERDPSSAMGMASINLCFIIASSRALKCINKENASSNADEKILLKLYKVNQGFEWNYHGIETIYWSGLHIRLWIKFGWLNDICLRYFRTISNS